MMPVVCLPHLLARLVVTTIEWGSLPLNVNISPQQPWSKCACLRLFQRPPYRQDLITCLLHWRALMKEFHVSDLL